MGLIAHGPARACYGPFHTRDGTCRHDNRMPTLATGSLLAEALGAGLRAAPVAVDLRRTQPPGFLAWFPESPAAGPRSPACGTIVPACATPPERTASLAAASARVRPRVYIVSEPYVARCSLTHKSLDGRAGMGETLRTNSDRG